MITMTTPEQRHQLYLKQVALLDTFLEKHAITRAQYEKSFHDLTEKMGEPLPEASEKQELPQDPPQEPSPNQDTQVKQEGEPQ